MARKPKKPSAQASKDELAQQTLDLEPTESSHLTADGEDLVDFMLKIEDAHLPHLSIQSIANIMTAFSNMMGGKKNAITFGTIQSGCVDVSLCAPVSKQNIVLSSITDSASKHSGAFKALEKELLKNDCFDVSIYSKHHLADDKEKVLIQKLDIRPEPITFQQEDTIDGQVIRLFDGRDASDHITIATPSGKHVPAECSAPTLIELKSYIKSGQLLRFEGIATYQMNQDAFGSDLKKFKVNNFFPVEKQSIDDWIDQFQQHGDSGWNQFADPIQEWLKERSE